MSFTAAEVRVSLHIAKKMLRETKELVDDPEFSEAQQVFLRRRVEELPAEILQLEDLLQKMEEH